MSAGTLLRTFRYVRRDPPAHISICPPGPSCGHTDMSAGTLLRTYLRAFSCVFNHSGLLRSSMGHPLAKVAQIDKCMGFCPFPIVYMCFFLLDVWMVACFCVSQVALSLCWYVGNPTSSAMQALPRALVVWPCVSAAHGSLPAISPVWVCAQQLAAPENQGFHYKWNT